MPIKAFPLELKALSAEGEFQGLASPYGNVDSGGDCVEPGAFDVTIAQQGPSRPLLYQHSDVIGTVTLADSASGLTVTGKLALAVQKSRDVYELMKAGAVKGLSIGYQSLKDDTRNGIRYLTQVKLFEISLVWAPMNEAAMVTAVKQQQDQEAEQNRRILTEFRLELHNLLQKRGR